MWFEKSFLATSTTASAVKFCQMTHDFFSIESQRPKDDFLFFFLSTFLDLTYIWTFDFGRYFSKKVHLDLYVNRL